MNPNRAVPGPWAVVVLLVGAMLIPRLQADRWDRHDTLSPDAIWKSASLDYARERVWGDFLASRSALLNDFVQPGPTLEEYRFYLASLGLTEPGCKIDMVVYPSLHPEHQSDRIQVALDRWGSESVGMSVAVWQDGGLAQPVGTLSVKHGNDGFLSCQSEKKTKSFWSYWPITPQPLLP